MTEKERFEYIDKIITRAEKMGITLGKRITHFLDVDNASKQFNMDLDAWLNADDFNFGHDFIGIYNNINRVTKKVENCFVPRFANKGDV